MKEKKKSPDNVSYAFMEKADISERQSIRIAIQHLSIKDKNIQQGYDQLLERQQKSLEAIKEHQEKQREKRIKDTKLELMDQSRKTNKPVYKPKFWPGLRPSEQAQAAEKDARYIVQQDERHRITTVENKFTIDQRRYLGDAIKSQHRCTEKFNKSAESSMPREQSNARGMER